MNPKKGTLKRDLNESWNAGSKAGDTVYQFWGCTYGCISPGGVAVTRNPSGDYPFFEVPANAVKWED
jgi:hypothetical protein